MKKIKILGLILLCSCTLFAQKNNQKIKYYKVWISTLDDSKVIKGYLYSADEETLKVIDNTSLDISNLIIVDPNDIDKIKIRRKGKIGKGILIGGGSGVLTGVLIGAIGSDGYETEAYSAGFATFFGIIGSGIGAGVGSIKKKILINGNIEIYKQNLNLLKGHSLDSSITGESLQSH